MKYDFPGNIRELENIIERAFILCGAGQIERRHLPELYGQDTPYLAYGTKRKPNTLKEIEAAFLMRVLEKNKWNRAKTAEDLGIHKSTLFRKIKALGLDVPRSKRVKT